MEVTEADGVCGFYGDIKRDEDPTGIMILCYAESAIYL